MPHVTRRQFLDHHRCRPGRHPRHRTPPARGQQREISYLCWNNFAPASDKKLAEIGQRFTKDTGIKIKIDHIAAPAQQAAKYASEVQTQAGHDLVEMRMHFPWLYEPQLVDVSDVVAELEKKYGKASPSAYEAAHVKGVWRAVPQYHALFVADVPRGPLQEGQPQGARHLGGPLHGRQGAEEDGAPGRDPHQPELRHDLDGRARAVVASAAWRSTRTARPSRSTRRPTAQMVEWYKKMYRDCMEPEVLSWSDASNNESIQQGKAGWIHNPVSAYIVARNASCVTADGINHHRSLAGPDGRHETDVPRIIGIWKFSKNVEPVEGVDPLPARQAGGLRRVHHVGRRLQPAGLRRSCRITRC